MLKLAFGNHYLYTIMELAEIPGIQLVRNDQEFLTFL